MAQDGYLLFNNSEQVTGYAVTVTRPEEPEGVFDTRRPGENDIFAVTMVRPYIHHLQHPDRGTRGR